MYHCRQFKRREHMGASLTVKEISELTQVGIEAAVDFEKYKASALKEVVDAAYKKYTGGDERNIAIISQRSLSAIDEWFGGNYYGQYHSMPVHILKFAMDSSLDMLEVNGYAS